MPLFTTLRRNKEGKNKDKEGYFCKPEQVRVKITEPTKSKESVQQLIEEIRADQKQPAVNLVRLTTPIESEKEEKPAKSSDSKHGKYKTVKHHSTPTSADTEISTKTLGRQSKPRSADMSVSSLSNHSGSLGQSSKMVLIQDKNGDFIIPERNTSKTLLKKGEQKSESTHSMDGETGYNKHVTESRNTKSSHSPKGGVQMRVSKSQTKLNHLHTRHLSVPDIMIDTELRKEEGRGSKGRKSSPSSTPDSGYDSATMTSMGKPPEFLRSSSPPLRMTAVDSIQLCFDSLTNMNLAALQQFCKQYHSQRHGIIQAPKALEIEDIELEEEPIHVNNKAVFYRAKSTRHNLAEFIAMISLKKPTVARSRSNYHLPVEHQYEVFIEKEIIPERIRKVAAIAANYPEHEIEDLDAGKIKCHLAILPNYSKIYSLQSYLRHQEMKRLNIAELEMDILFCFLQVISMMFSSMEQQLQIDALTMNDLVVVIDDEGIPTVCSHMVNVAPQIKPINKAIVCEKLQMFTLQLTHAFNQLSNTQSFPKVETIVQSAEDLGDIKTISLILQYMIWGPTREEVRVLTTADSRKQAFNLWVQLARGKLINQIASQGIIQHKTYMMAQFFSSTTGSELYNVTKLLKTH